MFLIWIQSLFRHFKANTPPVFSAREFLISPNAKAIRICNPANIITHNSRHTFPCCCKLYVVRAVEAQSSKGVYSAPQALLHALHVGVVTLEN